MRHPRLLFLLLAVLVVPRAGAVGQQPSAAPGISAEALAQIDALIAEKDARTPAQRKIDSQLLYEQRMEAGQPIADGIWAIETDLPYAGDGHLIVDVSARAASGLASRLPALGIEAIAASADGTSIRAHLDIAQVEALAADPDVVFVQPRYDVTTMGHIPSSRRPGFMRRAAAVSRSLSSAAGAPDNGASVFPTNTGQGSRSSEGDIAHLAFAARGAYGARGAGVKIGVLSDGVTNLAASQALGDLGPVTVLPGQTGSGDEGTAMLEIVHDLAPDAQLYFATAFSGITSFAQNIRDLRAAGCDIIVDDVFYYVESPFHDGQASGVVSTRNMGVVTQAVNDVTADGAIYFSSAGNSGNLNDGTSGTWEGDFVDGGPTASPVPAGNLHSFGGQPYDVLSAATTNPTNLYWSDPLGASSNDYDLFRLNSAGTAVVATSTNVQSGTQDPYEQISGSSATAGQRIIIVKKAGALPRFLHLGTNRGRLSIATAGETHGHSQAVAAFGVAATPAAGPFPSPFNSGNVVETFSSDGPRRVFFKADNTPYTPGDFSATGGEVHQKPDITAADGVSVTGVGGFSNPFFGTSAAAPHAAAIAGLLKSASPALTPAQIRATLNASAIDIEAPGVDRDSGAGIIMANAAMQSAGVPGVPFFAITSLQATDNPGNGNGSPEAGEGAKLVLPLANYGSGTARGILATLTTSSAGITATQPASSTYPDLAPSASGNGASPYLFTIAGDFPCPMPAGFSLSVNYTGAAAAQVISFQVPIGPPSFSITRNLDGTTPAARPGVATATGFQTQRIFRDGAASTCAAPKTAFPGIAANSTGNRQFDSYTFNTCANSQPSCVTVTLSGTSAIGLFSAAYVPTFNPADLSQNYVADAGSSSSSRTYSFPVAGGTGTFAIDVHDVPILATPPSGIAYTLKVNGACGGACEPPNHPPVARAKNVTVGADATCTAAASIDDGSSDADGDALTITQSPAGPYPIGSTTVLLTVTDPSGAASQATGIVTVVDTTPPAVSGFGLVAPAMWPPDHRMVDVTVNYGVADSCNASSCVLSVSSNEPVDGLGDGDTTPDWQIVDLHHVQLRAERSGKGTGRLYTITLTCTDAVGNVTVKTATVLVPHN